jgi:hypothetical protein
MIYTHSTVGKPARGSKHRTSRRCFLRRITAATLAMPSIIPARVLAAPGRPGANDRVIIGFIGTGGRSRQLMDHVPAEGRIVAICDSFRQRCLETLEQKQADWNTYQVLRGDVRARESGCSRGGHARPHPRLALHPCLPIRSGRIRRKAFDVDDRRRPHLGPLRPQAPDRVPGWQPAAHDGDEPVCVRVGADGRHRPHPSGCGNLLHRPPRLRRTARSARSGRQRLGSLAGPHRIPALPSLVAVRMDGLARLLGWRDDQLGRTRRRPDPMGAGHVPHGPCRDLADHPRAARQGGHALPQRGRGQVRTGPGPARRRDLHRQRLQDRINRNRFVTNPPDFVKNPPQPAQADIWEGPGWIARPHIQNWIDCIKSRALPNADVEIGHRSITVCHLANIARQLGRRLRWDPDRERFEGDDEADSYLDRPRRRKYELPKLT